MAERERSPFRHVKVENGFYAFADLLDLFIAEALKF